MAKVTLSGTGNWAVPEGVTVVTKVVIVAGGGGGGGTAVDGWPAGGGAGGGVVVLEDYAVSGSLAYSVGAGGAGGTGGFEIAEIAGINGANTVFNGVTALGGGGGGCAAESTGTGKDGGSGGGASATDGIPGSALQPASTDGGMGTAGGNSTDSADSYGGGGGGGASTAGGNAVAVSAGGAGGAGHTEDGQVYGSGGGGGTYDTTGAGAGGTNAGNGGRSGSEIGQSAVDGYGGGGGGAGASGSAGAAGGDGGDGAIELFFDQPDHWSEGIDLITAQTYYACEIDDGVLAAIRPPISSWQATVQSDRASYTQAVIPAATDWVSAITDRALGEFVIYRGVRYLDGSTQEVEMARAPLGDVRFDVGPTNATMTVSGYSTVPPSAEVLTRTMRNVRSESSANGLHRVRCSIDWLLRPGHTVIARSTTFEAAYINYYVTGGDEYMDVGERA